MKPGSFNDIVAVRRRNWSRRKQRGWSRRGCRFLILRTPMRHILNCRTPNLVIRSMGTSINKGARGCVPEKQCRQNLRLPQTLPPRAPGDLGLAFPKTARFRSPWKWSATHPNPLTKSWAWLGCPCRSHNDSMSLSPVLART